MLGVTRAKNSNADDILLKEVADELGVSNSFKGVDVGVYYNEDKSPRDPYFDGDGPLRSPCIECAGCMVGCRYNAKNPFGSDESHLKCIKFIGQKTDRPEKHGKINRKSD